MYADCEHQQGYCVVIVTACSIHKIVSHFSYVEILKKKKEKRMVLCLASVRVFACDCGAFGYVFPLTAPLQLDTFLS